MTIIELDGATIALSPIESNTAGTRRDHERRAIRQLADATIGADTEILHHADGSPYLSDTAAGHISISHSRHVAALLISREPGWGIDIEEARQEQLSRIAARVLGEDEISAYSHDLVQAWTLKEAAFKAAGLPIADLREIHLGANGTITARGLRLSIVESREVEAGAYRCRLSVVKISPLITP